jgi:hypothetical protein
MLRLAWMCGTSHLPEPGGVIDQDYMTMRLMGTARNVHDVVSRTKRLVGDEIHNMPVGDRQTIAYLRRIKVM